MRCDVNLKPNSSGMSLLWTPALNVARFGFLAVMLLPLVGCQHFFGNDRQRRDPLEISEQSLTCVRDLGTKSKAFFKGEEDVDPVALADCAAAALQKFANNTRGASTQAWTRAELSAFFENYFRNSETPNAEEAQAPVASTPTPEAEAAPASPEQNPVRSVQAPQASDRRDSKGEVDAVAMAVRRHTMIEVFRWKAALFGGSDQALTRDELGRVVHLLQSARPLLGELRGKGGLLGFQQVEAQAGVVDSLNATLLALGELLATEFENSSRRGLALGAMSRTKAMTLTELSESLNYAGLIPRPTESRLKVMASAKQVLLGGNTESLGGPGSDDWSELTRQAARGLGIALRYKYQVGELSGILTREISLIERIVDQIQDLTRRVLRRHDGLIANAKLARLIQALGEDQLLPMNLKAESVSATLEPLFGKLLGGQSLASREALKAGLQEAHLEALDRIAEDWITGQRLHQSIFQGTGLPMDLTTIRRRASQMQGPVGAQLAGLLGRGRPLVFDQEHRLLVQPEDRLPGLSSRDLAQLNTIRVLVNVVMRGYAAESSRAGLFPSLTEDEAQEVFQDLKLVGRDLGIVDVRSQASGHRTFMEANIFASVANGDAFIQHQEGVEWFSFVLSAGRLADRLHEDLSPACSTGPIDVFGKLRLRVECFRSRAMPVLAQHVTHLPNISAMLRRAQPNSLRELERASRALGDSPLPVESSELRAMLPILHYVESLFVRFDADRSGVLEGDEVWAAFPLIQPFISKLAGGRQLGETLERAVFSWLVYYGEPPDTSTSGKTKLLLWVAGRQFVTERASPENIISILSSFQTVSRRSKDRALQEWFTQNRGQLARELREGSTQRFEQLRRLMHCTETAGLDLRRLIGQGGEALFRGLPADSDDAAPMFAQRIKQQVQGDPRLQLLCQAF
ncbi:MAG TPA: hypothetical protein PLZ57_14470 [Pseudobdellovibrionaceae bacterium]|nr:hypothetical protein [Pseudobdellovibrionaceae bacterium]